MRSRHAVTGKGTLTKCGRGKIEATASATCAPHRAPARPIRHQCPSRTARCLRRGGQPTPSSPAAARTPPSLTRTQTAGKVTTSAAVRCSALFAGLSPARSHHAGAGKLAGAASPTFHPRSLTHQSPLCHQCPYGAPSDRSRPANAKLTGCRPQPAKLKRSQSAKLKNQTGGSPVQRLVRWPAPERNYHARTGKLEGAASPTFHPRSLTAKVPSPTNPPTERPQIDLGQRTTYCTAKPSKGGTLLHIRVLYRKNAVLSPIVPLSSSAV